MHGCTNRVLLTGSPGETAVPLEFDYGDASATLSGVRGPESPYTPLCLISGGPSCIYADVREVLIKIIHPTTTHGSHCIGMSISLTPRNHAHSLRTHDLILQIVEIKNQKTVFTYSEFVHEYIYGYGPFEARLSGCCRPVAQTSEVWHVKSTTNSMS